MEYEINKSDQSTIDINLLQTTNNSRMIKKKLTRITIFSHFNLLMCHLGLRTMTNSYKNTLALLLLVLLASCTSTDKKDVGVTFKKSYNLEHKAYDTELLISRGRIAVINNFLIVISSEQESFGKVYSIPNNMKEVYSFGRKGNGPGEFIQPILTYSYDNTFGLNEVNKQELAIMQLTNNNGNISIVEQTRLKAPYNLKKGEIVPPDRHFTKLNETHYVSIVLADDGRFFSLLDSTLSHINQFGESPIAEKLPELTYMNRLQGKIAANDGSMVFATSNLPYLASYKLKNNEMQKQWGFYYDQAYYGVRNGDLLFDKEKSFGQILDLKMDSRYIYVLYLDQLLSEYDHYDTEKSLANKILVFDYEGNTVAKLHLSCRISNMALYGNQTKLFGLAQLPEPTMFSLTCQRN